MTLSKKGLLGLMTAAAMSGAGTTLAQTDNQLEEVVVISSRIDTPLRQVGTSVSVIDREEIRNQGYLSLFDVLRSQPSVAVSNSGGQGQPTALRIRGEEVFRTVTFLDGLKLSDPSMTQIQNQLEHTLSSGVERVEILRGPQGFNYGADAGGLINIRTGHNSSTGLQGGLDAQTGSFDTHQLAGSLGGGDGRTDFFVSATRYETDGFNNRTADNVLRDDDGYNNDTLHGRIGFQVSDTLKLDLVHRQVDGETAYDNCYSNVTFSNVHDCDSDYTQEATRIGAELETGSLNHSLSLSQVTTDREFFTEGVSSFTADGETNRIEYLGNATTVPGAQFVFGVDAEEEVNNGTSRDQVGYYLEYLSDFSDNLYLTAGVRRDDNDDFGKHTSYRLTGAYLIDLTDRGTIKLRANYGTGFRAPSLYEIEYNKGPFAAPPASTTALKEEESGGYEAAIGWFGADSSFLEVVYFDQEIEDAILFDLATYSGYIQEIGTSTSEGIEISGLYPLTANLNLTGNYTFNETERPDGTQRQRRPEQLFNIGLSWQLDRLTLNAYLRGSRDSVDQVGATVIALDDYETLDLSARYQFNEQVELYARVVNLADQGYEEIVGYNNAGRAAYLGARLNF